MIYNRDVKQMLLLSLKYNKEETKKEERTMLEVIKNDQALQIGERDCLTPVKVISMPSFMETQWCVHTDMTVTWYYTDEVKDCICFVEKGNKNVRVTCNRSRDRQMDGGIWGEGELIIYIPNSKVDKLNIIEDVFNLEY